MKSATDRKPAPASLAEEREALLRAILDTAVDGIITIDSRGIVESFNPAAHRIFGYEPEEVIGRNVSMLMPRPDRDHHNDYLNNYLRTGTAKIIGSGREVMAQRKGGAVFPVELAISEVRLPDRRLFTGIVRDISARRRAELEARRHLDEHAHASRLAALGEMVSGIAHEVNQPLTAIISFADASRRILDSDRHNLDMVQDALKQISAQGKRAGSIVNRLRSFVRKRDAERSAIDINEVLRSALAIAGHEIRRRHILTKLEFDNLVPPLRADRIQIEQVVLNLVQNAIDAMADSEPRVLSLQTRVDNERVWVTVADSGPGFDREISEQMFEAFFTTKSKGTGLGLSISQSILAAHGGDLTARTGPEGGAVFEFSLPVQHVGTDT